MARVLDNKRSRPFGRLLAIGFPNRVPRPFVERVQGRRAVMVPRDKDQVARQGRRTPLAETVERFHFSKIVAFPDQFPAHGKAIQPARAEVGVDILPVGAGRRRGETVGLVRPLVRTGHRGRALPVNWPSLRSKQRSLNSSVGSRPAPCPSVGTAVVTKTWFSQTMGDERPLPASSAFQRMFFVLLHSTGGDAFGAVPLPVGPRQ